ncbi:MAG: APC family permease [Gammaproteobacteria bacterium]|nr:APC family permease [Gammaproteobacteria bacterium]MDE1984140.1 APC family permease [Gammaproteobacteria bacterium]
MAGPTKLRRDAGVIGLLYASLGAMIGSGWLFGPLHAALQAGVWSGFSWVIGAIAVLFLAFVFAELSTMFPNSGALVHMTHVSHGDLVGKIWTWILFLAFVSVPPVEVTSVLTYANNYIPGLINPNTGILTHVGTIVSILLLAAVVALNFLAIRIVVLINSAATWWKVVIPLATIGILMAYSFHPENMTAHAGSTPISGIFTAVATAGIIFSFLGFQQAIALAGETRHPGRYIPIALIGSVIISMLIYIGLQLSFIIALKPSDIAAGWEHLQFSGMFGPLAAIAVAVGAFWWAVILYIDAIVSPLGTAFIYATASPRIIMAAGEMGNAPKQVIKLNKVGVPWVGLIVTWIVGAIFFFPFPSWQKLVSAVSLITVLSYSIGPVILLHLRRALPNHPRPFKLRGVNIVSIIAFIFSNWIIYWTGYETVKILFSLVALYVVIYLIWFVIKRKPLSQLGWQQAWWLLPYFIGMWLISWFGPAGDMGGIGLLGFFTGMWILVVFSLVILWLALLCGQRADAAQRVADQIKDLGSRGIETQHGGGHGAEEAIF